MNLTRGVCSRARALQGAHPEPLRRLVRGVAIAFGISLCLVSETIHESSINPIKPKDYIRQNYSTMQASCLIRLYGKESAFDHKAIGNKSGKKKAYGIPQLKNPILKDLSPIEQINYGMKYIAHRYHGKPCLALKHSQRKGWY